MKIGLIGLGRMGYALALNMRDKGINVVCYNRSSDKIDQIKSEGVEVAYSIPDLISSLDDRKVVWLMVPAGEPVDQMISEVAEHLSPNDIIIDGGNSYYKDTLRRHAELSGKGIHLLDVGTSGGISGARYGACTMMGGDPEPANYVTPIIEAISTKDGFGYFGKPASGHYLKMIHNGIEYGMMQAIGEGFEILEASEFDYDYALASKVFSHGSIIEGLLIRLMHEAFSKEPKLDNIIGKVDSSGEADWTILEALRLKVSAPTIAGSLFTRFKSKDDDKFAEKCVAALRNEFGGHKVYTK